jgi:hypothetical protein
VKRENKIPREGFISVAVAIFDFLGWDDQIRPLGNTAHHEEESLKENFNVEG